MKMKAIITFLQFLLVFDQTNKASTIEKGIIYGVQEPSSLSNLQKIPQNEKRLNYFSYCFDGIIRSIASDSQRKVVFIATSFKIHAIHNYSLLKSESYVFSTEFNGKSDDTGEIAFDYLSKNLFWCDSRLNWVAMKPAYNGNASFYRVLVQDNLNRPEGLALDPVDGIMFFSDNYPNGRISKASLNGENSTVIVFKSLIHVPSLSIDTENNNLYWTDVVRNTVEVCDYNGFNRRVITRINMNPMSGIQFYKNVLHLVSEKKKIVRGVDALSGVYSYNVNFYPGIPKALAIFDRENLPNTPDPCYTKQCGQICVNTPSGPTCLCHEAYDLYEDGKSCIERPLMYKKGIIISTHNEFEIVNIASINNISTSSQSFKDSTANITSFAIDVVKAKIYYIDKKNDALKQMDLETLQINVLTKIQNGKDLILDWKQQLLGWINEDYTEILSFGLESGNTTSIYSKLGYAKSLTINPVEGNLYWISRSPPLIMSGNWNGKSPLSLVKSEELTFPKALNYDVTNNRLYWSEGVLIKSCLSNGLDIQTHSLAIEAADALSYKDFYVWILNQYLYVGLKSMKTYKIPIPIKDNVTGVAVFDPHLQKNLTGTCQVYNGGCDGICVPQQEGRRCECDLGLQLQNDLQTCSYTVFESNFVLVTDCTHDRILQVSLDTGELNKIPINATGAAGITFDKSTQTIFFTSSKYLFFSKVMSVSLHGQYGQWNINTYASGFQYSESVAIDFSTGNIYFAAVAFHSKGPDSIRVLNQETLEQKTLITSIYEPRSIALYSSKGLIFWTELGTQRIGKAHMDGTSIQYIVTATVTVKPFWPNGVAIDFTDQRLYWIDGFIDEIKSSDLNGGDLKSIAVDSFSHMRSIFVQGNYVYYTGFKRQRVMKIHKTTGARVPFMRKYPELGVLCDVFVTIENDTIDVHRLCAEQNGLCSTFCLPTPTGRTCGCPDNVELLPDQKTCEGVTVCPSLFSNLQLLNCPPYVGKSCEFECNPGFRKVTNSSVRCNALGQWEPNIDTLCIDILCPVITTKAVLKSDCTRKVGMSCGFLCKHNHVAAYSGDIVCGEDGTWDQPLDTLCTSTKTHEALNLLIIGLSTGLGFFALVTVICCIYCLYWRMKQNQTTEKVQKIHEVRTVELTNIGMETDEFPDGERQRPVSEGYSSLYEESDYGYMWLDDVIDPVHISTSSIGGDMILGEYIDPASEEEI